MAGHQQRTSPEQLLCRCAARRDGGRHSGRLWHLFWYDWRPGLLLAEWRRIMGGDCRASAGRTFSRGANAEIAMATVRVELPAHLRNLAKTGNEVRVEVTGAVTQRSVLDALEEQHPVLRGTIREHGTKK